MGGDAVDLIIEQWALVRPDLDVAPMEVLGRLSRASRLVEVQQDRVYAEYGLNRGEFDILATLRRAAGSTGMTAGDLARSSMVTSGAITNRIDRLIAKHHVTRDVDLANRRAVLIALTPAGRSLIDQVVTAHVENEQHLIAALTHHQQNDLADLLRQLLIDLGDTHHDETPDPPKREINH